MYLRTPKRYRPRQRRRVRLVSWRKLFFLALIPVVVLGAKLLWDNRAPFREMVMEGAEGVAANVQTQVAPDPTPLPTPDLASARAGCDTTQRAMSGNIEDAIKNCKTLAESTPNDAEMYYLVTHMLVTSSNFGSDQERMDEALAFAEKAINAAPESPHGWAIRSMALDWDGQYGKALASALHARALDDQFAPAYVFLAEIYHDLGQNDAALNYLDQAIALDTTGIALADAYRTRGLIFSNQGLYEDAVAPYERALQLAPNRSYIAIELATNYVRLGQHGDAIAILTESLEQNPTDTALLWALGYTNANQGDQDRGFEYYSRCLDVDPDNISCLSYLGGLQFASGNVDAAIANLTRAIDLGSTDPDDFLELGRSHAAQARCDLAVPYLQRGYQIALENEDTSRQERFRAALQSCNQSATSS